MDTHEGHYRAQTPKEKQEVIERLAKVWALYPSMRLGQLIASCSGPNLFYIEDFDLVAAAEHLAATYPASS